MDVDGVSQLPHAVEEWFSAIDRLDWPELPTPGGESVEMSQPPESISPATDVRHPSQTILSLRSSPGPRCTGLACAHLHGI